MMTAPMAAGGSFAKLTKYNYPAKKQARGWAARLNTEFLFGYSMTAKGEESTGGERASSPRHFFFGLNSTLKME